MAKALTLVELRKMSAEDLRKEVASHRKKKAELHLHVKLGKEKGVHLYRNAKKELARILTVLSELQRKQAPSRMPTSKAA
jgi:large subunit ribosomal protein L29